MSDRKYRQRGYMDHGGQQEQRSRPQTKPQAKPQEREGPRSPKMMAFGTKVKCDGCGTTVQANIAIDTSCPKCNADLHTCRHCTSFDPGARFECRKPITARIANKGASSPLQLPRYTGKRLPYRNLSIWRVEADAAQKSVGSRLDNYSRTWYRYPHEL